MVAAKDKQNAVSQVAGAEGRNRRAAVRSARAAGAEAAASPTLATMPATMPKLYGKDKTDARDMLKVFTEILLRESYVNGNTFTLADMWKAHAERILQAYVPDHYNRKIFPDRKRTVDAEVESGKHLY